MKERFQLKWNREERMISNKKKRVDNTKVKILNLDEAGWGLGSMIIFMCIIIIFIIIVAVEIKRVDEERRDDSITTTTAGERTSTPSSITEPDNSNFSKVVVTLRDTARKYSEENELYLADGEPYILSMSRLINDGYMGRPYYENQSCSGYAKVTKYGNDLEVESYVKCGTFQSTGYDASLDN